MNKEAEGIILKLGLVEHPEGGYFKEVYRSKELINQELPSRYEGPRCFSTSIFFMLCDHQYSKLHRIKSDEIWHHYLGCSIKLYIIYPAGQVKTFLLGRNLDNNELPQITIPHDSWFGAELCDKDSYALVGCTVSPGFEFNDFELGRKDYLLEKYPQHSEIINNLT